MLTVFCLVTCSVFALVASVVLGYVQFGAANMQDVPFHCWLIMDENINELKLNAGMEEVDVFVFIFNW